MIKSEIANEFVKNGFVIIPNVLAESEIKEFRSEFSRIHALAADKSQGDNEYLRSDVLVRFPLLQSIFFRPAIIEAIKSILGDDFLVLPEITTMKSQFGGWHKDTTSIEIFGQNFHKNSDFRILNAAIYLQGNGAHGGGLDVVPGSHNGKDDFVSVYQKTDYKNPGKKKTSPGIFSFGKRGLAFLTKLVSSSLHKKLTEAAAKSAYLNSIKLDSSDTHPGKYTIPSKAGDLVIFDLRLDHKASWPRTLDGFLESPQKFAFFAICGANNETSREYLDYLKVRSQTQAAYNYLKHHKVPPELEKISSSFGISTL